MDDGAGDHVEGEVDGAGAFLGVGFRGEFTAGLGARAALDDQALLAFHDRGADAFAQGFVAGRLRDHRHQTAAALGAVQERRELQDHALDVRGQAARVRQPQLVEELRDRVDDQLVLAGPAAVQRGLRDPRAHRHVLERELGPAQLHQRFPGRGQDRGVRGGAARAPGTAGGGAALHPPTITGR